MRLFQAVGAAMLMANSGAILTDAFPAHQRGTAMGINSAAAFSGMFIGLVLGGVLAPLNWRLVFLVSVPIGLFGTVFGYLKLRELAERRPAKIDWPGNITFALGLILVMVGITYGIEPYHLATMGWTNPFVEICLSLGVALLIVFAIIETKVPDPMFRLQLFKIRPFTCGVLASFLAALSRGGLMFMLIIWLQGIWLPLHGYDFARTPLWAGLAMLPLTAGFLIAGPISGHLSDRYGARPFASGGMVGSAICFGLLALLPIDCPYWLLAIVLLATGLSMSMFGSPNRAAVMNSLPPEHRGAGGGMSTTFQNSAQVLSIGIFFSLLIFGLSGSLTGSLYNGLVAHGVATSASARISHLPPVSTLFAAFLGYNPIQHLLGSDLLSHLSATQQATLTGRQILPRAHRQAVPRRTARRAVLRHRDEPRGGRRIVGQRTGRSGPGRGRPGGGGRGGPDGATGVIGPDPMPLGHGTVVDCCRCATRIGHRRPAGRQRGHPGPCAGLCTDGRRLGQQQQPRPQAQEPPPHIEAQGQAEGEDRLEGVRPHQHDLSGREELGVEFLDPGPGDREGY